MWRLWRCGYGPGRRRARATQCFRSGGGELRRPLRLSVHKGRPEVRALREESALALYELPQDELHTIVVKHLRLYMLGRVRRGGGRCPMPCKSGRRGLSFTPVELGSAGELAERSLCKEGRLR